MRNRITDPAQKDEARSMAAVVVVAAYSVATRASAQPMLAMFTH
jgi:hypothetical protein